MKIGIIGSGNIGGTLARLFARAGREVAIANSRGPESLQRFASETGGAVRAAAIEEAISFGEVVVLAIPLREYKKLAAARFRGKIVVDAMNYYSDRDGHITPLDSNEVTSSELVAEHLSDARVVKAFNTIHAEHLANNGDTEELIPDRQAIFVAGDDREAKSVVSGLIEDIGFAPVDHGTLAEGGRKQQPGTPVYGKKMTGREAMSRQG